MKLDELLDKLYIHIKHGDEEHQQWLKDEIDKFVSITLSTDDELISLSKLKEVFHNYQLDTAWNGDFEEFLKDCQE